MRDDFTEEVKRTLAARVGNRCSNPTCRALTSGPQDDPAKALNVGVAAHITAAAQGGPRYDTLLSSEERCHADNGIWLCQTCAKLVDNDTSQFPSNVLRAWKTIAENDARSTIGKTRPIQQSEGGKGSFSLPVTQEALDVRIESGWGQQFSIVLSNNSDQAFAVIGVSVEYEGTTLGTINRPQKDTAWAVAAKGRTVISWPPNTNVVNDLIKTKREHRQQYSARVDFIFQCEVDRQSTQFRKRILVQVDPMNRYVLQN
jgi:hypothetical protein